MNRRGFLRGLTLTPVIAKLAPVMKLLPEAPVLATIGGYRNFSEFVRSSAIDETIEVYAVELGRRAGLAIYESEIRAADRGYQFTYDYKGLAH